MNITNTLFALLTVICAPATYVEAGNETRSLAGPPDKPTPLYLLTYDHGGLVLWGKEHFAERLRDAVSWLDKYPDFKIGLDNEAHAYDVLAEQNPQLLEEIRGWLKRYAGRFGIGTCTYGQPLSTFINEESNVRQLVYAIRADQLHFGCTPKVYLMSEHAMHSQIPQLLAGCGFQGAIMRTHFMMYGYNPTFDAPIGWWLGLDGSRIATIPTYPGEGSAFGKTTVDNWILTRWPSKDTPRSLADFCTEFARIRPLLASRADDSNLRREALVQECQGKAKYRWLLLDELLNKFPEPAAEFRTRPNDFVVRMPWGYCGNEIWNASRRAEVQVLTAERLAALELLSGGSGDREADLDTAWKNLLVAQHHDIQICGLLADSRRFLPASLAASARVRDGAMQFFASRTRGEGLLQLTVFNPSSWTRRQWIEAELAFSEKGRAHQVLVTHRGRTSLAALLSAERYSDGSLMTARATFPAEVTGLTVAAYCLAAAGTNVSNEPAAPGLSVCLLTNDDAVDIVTPDFSARLHPDGGLALLEDRRTRQAWLKPGRRSAFFAATLNGGQCESKGRWTLPGRSESASAITVREDGFIGSIPYTFELTFRADSPRLDGHARFHIAGQKLGRVSTNQRDGTSGFIHEEKLRFKLFPNTSGSAVGVRDLPFAVAETTNGYLEGNYWTALSDGHTGMAVFNRGTMGSVREEDGGLSVPLAFAMYYIWGTRMLNGDFDYEFALLPFSGNWAENDLHRRALEYNFPMVSVATGPGKGPWTDEVRPLEIGSSNVLLSALYPEQGKVMARLYESQGRHGQGTVEWRGGHFRLEKVDLLGGNAQPAVTPLVLEPWQIQTARILP